MEHPCKREHCFAPEDRCLMGQDDPHDCTNFQTQALRSSDAVVPPTASSLPWSGNAFGVADLSYVASLTRPKVIGVIGPHSAGKTTLLATIYLLLQHGVRPGTASLARSYTLGGWEATAAGLRFNGQQAPSFPAHTSMREARMPGLLHLGFREAETASTVDLAITDAPGEWFRRWAIDEDAADVAGARWVADKSDAFIMTLDSAALAGTNSGTVLSAYQQLLERLKKHLRKRPLHIVWTKSDLPVPADARQRLEDRIGAIFPEAHTTSVSVKTLDIDLSARSQYISLLSWMLHKGTLEHVQERQRPHTSDPFLTLR